VLHLHGIHDQQRWPAATASTSFTGDADDCALHGAPAPQGSFRASSQASGSAWVVVLPNANTASGSTASTRAPACRRAVVAGAADWK